MLARNPKNMLNFFRVVFKIDLLIFSPLLRPLCNSPDSSEYRSVYLSSTLEQCAVCPSRSCQPVRQGLLFAHFESWLRLANPSVCYLLLQIVQSLLPFLWDQAGKNHLQNKHFFIRLYFILCFFFIIFIMQMSNVEVETKWLCIWVCLSDKTRIVSFQLNCHIGVFSVRLNVCNILEKSIIRKISPNISTLPSLPLDNLYHTVFWEHPLPDFNGEKTIIMEKCCLKCH